MRPGRGRRGYHGGMSKLLLNLRNVPEDEADEVRAWLRENAIAFYETQPSPWGISSGGIWIQDEAEMPRARALMADYQAQRQQRAQARQAEARSDGSAETFGTLLRRRPWYVLGMLVAIVGIVALTLALPYLLIR